MQFTRSSAIAAAFAAISTIGCAAATHRTTTVESGGDVATTAVTPVTPANNRTIPTGALVMASLDQALGTKISKAGDTFTATVSQTLYASDGSVVVPAGAKIDGTVTALDDSDNATEPALIRLNFNRIRFNGMSYPFAASISQSNPVQTNDGNANKTKQIVIGGVVGAAIGGILGKGDLDKIVIGGAIGAAAGSVVSLGTEMNATLPAGSIMTLQATQTTYMR